MNDQKPWRDKVVNLADFREDPHLTGPGECLACKHRWAAVAPIGTTILDCPKCGLGKGVFANLVVPEEMWQCNCGCFHFFVSRAGVHCVLCGLVQSFP